MNTHAILLPQESLVGQAESLIIPINMQLHLYCPHCGEPWAHAIPLNPEFQYHDYRPLRCRTHGNGTLLLHFQLSSLPSEFLRREVLLRREPLIANSGCTYISLRSNEP